MFSRCIGLFLVGDEIPHEYGDAVSHVGSTVNDIRTATSLTIDSMRSFMRAMDRATGMSSDDVIGSDEPTLHIAFDYDDETYYIPPSPNHFSRYLLFFNIICLLYLF